MATPERENGTVIVEQKSSIKAVRNSKGDAQFEVKVVAGESDEALTLMRQQAVAQYRELAKELG
jgi:hypothetical protein